MSVLPRCMLPAKHPSLPIQSYMPVQSVRAPRFTMVVGRGLGSCSDALTSTRQQLYGILAPLQKGMFGSDTRCGSHIYIQREKAAVVGLENILYIVGSATAKLLSPAQTGPSFKAEPSYEPSTSYTNTAAVSTSIRRITIVSPVINALHARRTVQSSETSTKHRLDTDPRLIAREPASSARRVADTDELGRTLEAE